MAGRDMTKLDRLDKRLYVGLAAAVLVAACVGPGVGASAPVAPGSAAPASPAPSASAECIVVTGDKGGGSSTTLDFSAMPLITVGTFDGYGKAAWNTPDGHRPTLDEVQRGPYTIWQPLKTRTESAIKGDAKNVTKAVVRGGTIGCDSFDYGIPALTDGSRYVFFFYPIQESDAKVHGDYSLVSAWPVDSNNVVTRPVEDPISLADLTSALTNPAAPSVTPYPTEEPSPSGPG